MADPSEPIHDQRTPSQAEEAQRSAGEPLAPVVAQALQGLAVGHGPGSLGGSSASLGCRMLFGNQEAGIIIGRGGSNRQEIQASTGVRMQLSRPNEFWPGTTDRVLLLTGTVPAIVTALYHILNKISQDVRLQQMISAPPPPDAEHEPGQGEDEAARGGPSGFQAAGGIAGGAPAPAGPASLAQQRSSAKLLLPATVCGSVIGRRGETVKAFAADSGASISLSPQDRERGLDYDRIVTVHGSVDKLLRAVALILAKAVDTPPVAPQQTVVPAVIQQQQQQQQQQQVPQQQQQQQALSLRGGVGTSYNAPLASYGLGAAGLGQYGVASSLNSYSPAPPAYSSGLGSQAPAFGLGSQAPTAYSTGLGSQTGLGQAGSLGSGAFSMRSLQQALQQQQQQQPQQATLQQLQAGSQAALLQLQQQQNALNASAGVLGLGLQQGMLGGQQVLSPSTSSITQRVEVSMLVPQQHVGAIIGRGGSVLHSLKNLLNVQVVVADRDSADQVAGGRRVHIYGAADAVQMAQQIIQQKVQESAAFTQPGVSLRGSHQFPLT